jgi:hypothetical protein
MDKNDTLRELTPTTKQFMLYKNICKKLLRTNILPIHENFPPWRGTAIYEKSYPSTTISTYCVKVLFFYYYFHILKPFHILTTKHFMLYKIRCKKLLNFIGSVNKEVQRTDDNEKKNWPMSTHHNKLLQQVKER